MAFLCPAKLRRSKRSKGRPHDAPLPARITGSASIDTLVRVGLEKDLEHTTPMIVLHDFEPCVDDEVAVHRGDHVMMLYKERDWAYIIASDNSEGFIPSVYCAPIGSKLSPHTEKTEPVLPPKQLNSEYSNSNNNKAFASSQDDLESDGLSKQSDSLLNVSSPTPFNKITYGRYIVLFCFRAQQEDDIAVSRGHFVTVLNRDDPDWFWIQRSDGEEGFVPSTYLCPAEGQTLDINSAVNSAPSGIYSGQASISKLPTMSTMNAVPNAQLPQMPPTSTDAMPPPEWLQSRGSGAISPQSKPHNFSSFDWPYNSAKDNPVTNGNHIKLQCQFDYTARVPDDLSVMKGEVLYADLKDQPAHDWLWAYSMVAKRFGYIPRSFAQLTSETQEAPPVNLHTSQNDPFLSP